MPASARRRAIRYGPSPDQEGDLHLPDAPRPPVVCLLHGGFWRMPWGRDQMTPLADDLASRGVAVWNLEYRRLGAPGAGWPGTLEDVASGMEHLSRLVDDLFDVSRITSGKVVLQSRTIDVATAVTHAVECIRPFIDARDQKLAIDLPQDPIRVNGDLTRLAQVVQNLLQVGCGLFVIPVGAGSLLEHYCRLGLPREPVLVDVGQIVAKLPERCVVGRRQGRPHAILGGDKLLAVLAHFQPHHVRRRLRTSRE